MKTLSDDCGLLKAVESAEITCMDYEHPIHYDENGVAWPHNLWLVREAQLQALERETKRRNDRISSFVSIVGAGISLVAAGASIGSLHEARVTRINDERPYVAVDVEKESVETAQFASTQNLLYVDIISSGKTPALHIHGECEAFHKPISRRPTFISTGKSFENTYLLPSRSYSILCPYVLTDSDSTSSTDPITILGYVKYTDGDLKDNEKYATPFCYDVGTLHAKLTVIPCFTENNGLPVLR